MSATQSAWNELTSTQRGYNRLALLARRAYLDVAAETGDDDPEAAERVLAKRLACRFGTLHPGADWAVIADYLTADDWSANMRDLVWEAGVNALKMAS